MQFALLGNHSDGLDLAQALVASGRHELAAYSGPVAGVESLRCRGLNVQPIGDFEEVLANPAVEAVIVAGPLAARPMLLRRALQSERHVLCVHPADQGPDLAYEAAMIQNDTRQVLLPLLPRALHPGVTRLVEIVQARDGSLGPLRLLEMEWRSPNALGTDAGTMGAKVSLPGWDILRALGGEVAELSAFAAGEETSPDEPLLVSGRFERGGLFQITLLLGQSEPCWRLAVIGSKRRAELTLQPDGPGLARLTWEDETGTMREESWDNWNPWLALVEVFEAAVRRGPQTVPHGPRPTWQDEVRALELDDAVRRSLAHHRASTLEYPEATEEVGFKGTMTLIGCAVLWLIPFLLVLSVWEPRIGWLILPILALFLLLQLLQWLLPTSRKP